MARLLAVLSLALFLVACTEPPPEGAAPAPQDAAPRPFLNLTAAAAFVGDDACFNCHEDLWRGYQAHGMARSYYPLTPENAVEDFAAAPVRHPSSNFYYRALWQDGAFYQEEYRLDAAGRKVHRLLRRMDYVVGSGTAARTYLTEQHGRLYEMPLTWYTQVDKWDFSPGYRERNSRFERLIPDACMACHNGYPETVPFVQGKYTSVPNGIGCERCHGPGGPHVEERLANPDVAGDVDYSIVNPRHLSLDRQLDVCQQCHLHGTVEVERAGRGPFGYRPSEPLSAHIALFATEDAGPEAERISVISHADRMKRSACFQATAASATPMTCVTCHNPHEGFRDKGPSYFNETCLTCHAPAALQARFETAEDRATHAATANCMTCHMPKVEADDAPHASFTDHWIRVVGAAAGPAAPLSPHAPGDLRPYFAQDADGFEASIYRGMALVKLGMQQADTSAIGQGVTLLEATLRAHPAYPEAQLLLGIGQKALGRFARAVPALEQAVQLDPGNPEYLYGLADAYEKTRRDPATIERLYRQALTLQPALSRTRVNFGRFLETQGRLDDAIDQYRQAIEEEPWLEEGHYNLGTAYLQQQDVQRAEASLLEAVALNPDYADALGNLGLLYASQGALEKARGRFEQALEAAPSDPTALGNLGTFYLNQGALDRAIGLLARAVQINPRYVNGLVNLSLAHFRKEEWAQARQYAQQALQLNPQNETARQLLDASSL